MTSPPQNDELTPDQFGLAAQACDVHRQMLYRKSRSGLADWKREEAEQQMADLRIASDWLKRQQESSG